MAPYGAVWTGIAVISSPFGSDCLIRYAALGDGTAADFDDKGLGILISQPDNGGAHRQGVQGLRTSLPVLIQWVHFAYFKQVISAYKSLP